MILNADVEALRAQIGAVWCPTCEQYTLPLTSGRCGWCETWIVLKDESKESGELT
jgi:hypothetical protein